MCVCTRACKLAVHMAQSWFTNVSGQNAQIWAIFKYLVFALPAILWVYMMKQALLTPFKKIGSVDSQQFLVYFGEACIKTAGVRNPKFWTPKMAQIDLAL